MNRNITYLLIAAVMTLLSVCSCNDEFADPGEVILDLTVVVNDGGFPQNSTTRAFTEQENDPFENPANNGEKLRTLRVIIVHTNRKTGKVEIEHNRMVTIDPESGNVINDNLRFPVVGGETKTVYLFGNEKWTKYDSAREIWEPIYDFGSLVPGYEFSDDIKEALENLQIVREPDMAVVDNSKGAMRTGYVPMSESFTFDVQASNGDVMEVKQTLFLTRSLVKFSFCFMTDEDYPVEDTGIAITGVKVENIADRCYYLPKATEYNPAWNVTVDPDKGRVITSFETPADMAYSGFDFGMKPSLDVNDKNPGGEAGSNRVMIAPGLDVSYSPLVYLPETKPAAGTAIGVSIELNGNGNWLTSQPLEMKDIPRNTHVKVNITIKSTSISAKVVLLPYTGVELEPDFGL